MKAKWYLASALLIVIVSWNMKKENKITKT